MQVLFAKQDIDQANLKVKAGHPLPSRFQQSTIFTLKSLRESLGPDAIISLTEDTKDYMLVSTAKLAALEAENAELKEQLAAKGKGRKATVASEDTKEAVAPEENR